MVILQDPLQSPGLISRRSQIFFFVVDALPIQRKHIPGYITSQSMQKITGTQEEYI